LDWRVCEAAVPPFVDRSVDLAEHRGLVGTLGAKIDIGFVAAAGAALQRDGRIQTAFGDVDRGRCHIDIEACRDHRGMAFKREIDGLVPAARQQPINRFGRAQSRRRIAYHLGVGCLADGEIDLGGVEVGETAVQPGFGLRSVGRRDVTGIQASLGNSQCFRQRCDVDALGFDQRLVGQHVAVGGDGVEQHALADIAQRLAAGSNLKFGDSDAVGGPEPVEQHLGDRALMVQGLRFAVWTVLPGNRLRTACIPALRLAMICGR
jgi:hypothetical protein